MPRIGFRIEHQISPDGKIIALWKGHSISLLYPETNEEFELQNDDGFIAFSANLKYFALTTFYRSSRDIVYLYDTISLEPLAEYPLNVNLYVVGVSDNAEVVVTTGDKRLLLLRFDEDNGELVLTHEKQYEVASPIRKITITTNPLRCLVRGYSLLAEDGKKYFGAELLHFENDQPEIVWQKNYRKYPWLVYPLLQNQLGQDQETSLLVYSEDFTTLAQKISTCSFVIGFSRDGKWVINLSKKEVRTPLGTEFWLELTNLETKQKIVSERLFTGVSEVSLNGLATMNEKEEVILGFIGKPYGLNKMFSEYHYYVFKPGLVLAHHKVFGVGPRRPLELLHSSSVD